LTVRSSGSILANRFAESIQHRLKNMPRVNSSSRPTLADVAARAGVARSTASYIINGVKHARVAEETRARVLAAVEELDYRPNAAARGLRTQRTLMLGFVSDHIAAGPYAGETIRGAQDVAWEAKHLLLIANTDGEAVVQRAAVEAMIDRQIDGLLVAAVAAGRVDVEPLRGLSVPCVLVNCFSDEDVFPQVFPDDERGGREAAEILLAAGHRRIAFINGARGVHAAEARLRGFRAALARHGVEFDRELAPYGNWWPDSGYEHACRLLELESAPTAIFCGNDRMAIGVYEALKERGLRIPEDVSVLGYDDMELAQRLRPALSTMALPHYEMGRWACERLLSGQTQALRELLWCPPRERASVGPPSQSSGGGG
jgi:LacI family transcriptional regulator